MFKQSADNDSLMCMCCSVTEVLWNILKWLRISSFIIRRTTELNKYLHWTLDIWITVRRCTEDNSVLQVKAAKLNIKYENNISSFLYGKLEQLQKLNDDVNRCTLLQKKTKCSTEWQITCKISQNVWNSNIIKEDKTLAKSYFNHMIIHNIQCQTAHMAMTEWANSLLTAHQIRPISVEKISYKSNCTWVINYEVDKQM